MIINSTGNKFCNKFYWKFMKAEFMHLKCTVCIVFSIFTKLCSHHHKHFLKFILAMVGFHCGPQDLPCCMWGFCFDEWGYSLVAM